MSTEGVYLDRDLRFVGLDIYFSIYVFMSIGKVYFRAKISIWVSMFLCRLGEFITTNNNYNLYQLGDLKSQLFVYLESLSRMELKNLGLRYLFEYLCLMSTGKVYLELDLKFQGIDIYLSIYVFMSTARVFMTNKIYINWETWNPNSH